MADSDYVEFSVAQGRKYTLEHLWLQVLDEKKSDSQVKIGLSEFVRAEFGDIIRVILTKPEDDSEFKIEDSENRTDLSCSLFHFKNLETFSISILDGHTVPFVPAAMVGEGFAGPCGGPSTSGANRKWTP